MSGQRLAGLLRAWRTAGALAVAVVLAAHVGTDDVFYAGEAGPWSVRISIRQPGVIPGLADISVRVAEPGVERVTVTARQTREGGGTAPPPDEAKPVRGESGLYAAQLWLMVRGSHEVLVTVAGTEGDGVARIPIVAAATRQLEMSRGLGLFVLGGGIFLVVGLLTIVGAATRESVLPAGQQPSAREYSRARISIAVATVLLALLLFGGWKWIDAEAAAHRARLDRPWQSTATLRVEDGSRTLEFAITEPFWVNRNDEGWRERNSRYRRADLVPDHGKMMHLFLVRDSDLDAFAHVHPTRLDDSRFEVPFPPLPPGTYRVYADITHEDGLSHTLSTTVDVPPSEPGTRDAGLVLTADPDDAWWSAGAGSGSVSATAADPVVSAATGSGDAPVQAPDQPEPTSTDTSPLDGETVMRWLNASEALMAGTDADLVFRVEDAAGNGVALDPYMGMTGHAMLNRDDAGVFVHLHPSGMISMAAQSALEAASGERSSMPPGMDMAGMADAMSGTDGTVRFPLIVPEAGRYRIWIQVRRGSRVLTGRFDTTIQPGASE